MAGNSKISNLDPAAGLTGTEELPVVQAGETVKTTTQDIVNLVPPSGNLGNENLIADANRTYTLKGSFSTDQLTFKTGSGDDVMSIRGDNSIYIPNGKIGIGVTPSSVTKLIVNSTGLNYGFRDLGSPLTAQFYAVNPSKSGFLASQVQNGGIGMSSETNITSGTCNLHKSTFSGNIGTANITGHRATAGVSGTATGGTFIGFDSHLVTGTVNNIGFRAESSGATGSNTAFEIVAGEFVTPSGVGQTETVTFGGGSTGDIATMTFENGIYISNTVVP